MKDLSIIRSAWEDFMSNRTVCKAVRPVVLESWKRSRNQQAPAMAARAKVVRLEDVPRHDDNTLLQRFATPVLERTERWLSDTHSMLMLTDAQGLIMQVRGDSRTMARGHEVGLEPGGRWCEREIGTNAIGTALAVNAPVRIHAFEHFCESVQRWSCAAAPVREPGTGRLLGVVDISSPVPWASEQSLAYASLIAHHIHTLFEQQRQRHHATVLQQLLKRMAHDPGRAMLALDCHGHILQAVAMPSAHGTSPLAHLEGYGKDLAAILNRAPPSQWSQTLLQQIPGADIEIIQPPGQAPIGALLILPHGKPGTRKAPASTGHDHPDHVGMAPSHTSRHPIPPALQAAFQPILGDSAALRATLERAAQLAEAEVPILLEGETGTGKELFAQALHRATRHGKPFVPVNCGGLPHELIGSEIFGYERGAFTGAAQTGRIGKLEAANGGTFCLDEIGEMPLELQPYLLRVLEDRQVFRIGSHVARDVDVRLIAMTNRDLQQEIHAGRFRQDLFYRIAVAHLRIPALRERADDVPVLVQHFAAQAAARNRCDIPVFSRAAMEHLRHYGWPGNIRQLRNCVEMAVLLDRHGWIDLEHLPPEILQPASKQPDIAPVQPMPANLHQLEKNAILRVIEESRGNLSAAAKRLGIARSTLYSRLSRLS